MRDPYRKKQRELRRVARSARRPYIYELFDIYNPEYKGLDNYSLSWQTWHIYHDAQNAWVRKIGRSGGYGMGGIPSWFRRDRNRQLRTRQKGALNKAFREDRWDDFILPLGRRDVRWFYW